MNSLSSTNRQDPDSIKSRIFIGNLNTMKMSRSEVLQIFSKYGEVLGISMHKGYAFVQYSNEYEARFAVDNEDAKNYYGKDIDVTVASEPKARKRVRPNVPSSQPMNSNLKSTKGGIVDLMAVKTAPTFPNQFTPIALPTLINTPNQLNVFNGFLSSFQCNTKNNLPLNNSGAKRTRLEANNCSVSSSHLSKTSKNLVPIITNTFSSSRNLSNRTLASNRSGNSSYSRNNENKSYRNSSEKPSSFMSESNFDILLCGRCRKCFDSVEDLMSHKLAGCTLGKKSKDSDSTQSCKAPGEPSSLDCFYCGQNFYASWDLISHCEVKHEVKIYSLPDKKNQSSSECDFPETDKDYDAATCRNSDDEDVCNSPGKRNTDSNYSPSNNSEISSISINQTRKSEEIPEPDCTLVTLCDNDGSEESDNDDHNDEINLKLSSPKLPSKRKPTSNVGNHDESTKKSIHDSLPRSRLRSEVSRHEANLSSGDEEEEVEVDDISNDNNNKPAVDDDDDDISPKIKKESDDLSQFDHEDEVDDKE